MNAAKATKVSILPRSVPSNRRKANTAQNRDEPFDWHSDPITVATPVGDAYKNTQNVRRFLRVQCADPFRFDRPFMQWIKDGSNKTMGDVAQEWKRRRGGE